MLLPPRVSDLTGFDSLLSVARIGSIVVVVVTCTSS
jgi:hypothetical protein